MWTDLHGRVHATLRQRQLLPKDSRLLLAVSGGQDSLCLLKLLADLQEKWGWELAIAHCDHRWAWDGDLADWVGKLARDWQLPYYLKTAAVVRETEAAAREWRYRCLGEIAEEEGFRAVVTGHTQSDRAETLLYNLIRGAGADGLQALSWQRPLRGDIALVRPLLAVSRQETLAFCQQFQLPIWPDRANDNLNYARNRIRKQVIPQLQTHFNPQVETALAQTAEILRADVEYLEENARQLLEQAIAPDGLGLDRRLLQGVPLALQRRAVRQFLQGQLQAMPDFEQVEALTRLIAAPNRTRSSSLPGKAIAEVRDPWIALIRQPATPSLEEGTG